MDQTTEYLGLLVIVVLSALIAGLMLLLATVLGPKRPSLVKSQPFECGSQPFTQPSGRFPVKFYLVAMLFILFDVEIVWLFPWAVVLRKMGAAGLVEMFFFLGIVTLGYAYAWKKGALEWEK